MSKQQKIYFQWQNEALLKTIYPLRTMNLRNALEFYMEIDLWKEYGKKRPEDLPAGEIEKYHEKKAAVTRQAKQDYEDLRAYFYKEPPLDPAKLVDDTMWKKIKGLHAAFDIYYRDLTDIFRQSYFISQRLAVLDRDRKTLDQQVSAQKRRIQVIQNQDLLPGENRKLEGLLNAQAAFEECRKQLVALLSAFGKIESRRKDFARQRESAEKKLKEISIKLLPLKSKIVLQQTKLKELQDDAGRLRRRIQVSPTRASTVEAVQIQPEPGSVENYFADPDTLTEMASRFPQADPDFCRLVDGMREEIAALQDRAVKRARLREHIFTLQLNRGRYEKQSSSKFKENTLKAYDEVLDFMKEYGSILDSGNKPPEMLEQEVREKEQKVEQIQEFLKGLWKEAEGWQRQIDEMEILNTTEDHYVYQYKPAMPTMKDFVMLKLEEYRETLLAGDKAQDPFSYQFFLLDLLIQRFKREPRRFPRWLQYMIVHFSGMRYASAHGSWADPRDLYLNLRIGAISADLDKSRMNDFAVQELRQQKIAEYTGIAIPDFATEYELPKFARAQDEASKAKIEAHLALLTRDDPDSQRKGLLNLLLDEEDFEIKAMTEQDALEALEDLREQKKIPDWMWKEISALTDLRLTEAKDKDWGKLTPDEQAQKNTAEWAKYREVMKNWKEKHLTGWRGEHDRSNELIVSRAVCNEVAEHILHLRGYKGPAGLSSAADWFINAAKRDGKVIAQKEAGKDAAYFMKPKEVEDYRPGAAILWLKYRNDPPPLWNVVKPFTVGKDKLLPDNYLNGGRWTYKDSGLFRSGTFANDKGLMVKRNQYLFWVHIATVAEVAETAEGQVVLTFETSLPYEDRRLSCVGIFKRAAHNLLFDGGEDTYNGSFVGYVPDNLKDIPTRDLDEMLNWDHVLLKS